MHHSLKRMWALLGVVAVISATVAASATAAHKAGPNIVIWTDQDRAAAVTKVANAWAATNGATIQVVTKNFGDIRDNLGTVAAADAPDVITAAHDWTGQLAANGLVQPLYPSKARQCPVPGVHAQRVLVRNGRQEAVRHARRGREHRPRRQHGARQGADDVRAARDRGARSSRRRSAQPSASPFSRAPAATRTTCTRSSPGLGGYVFGTNKAGNLDPSDIGVANPTFLKNAQLIDKWNKEGLINSKVDSVDGAERLPEGAGRVLDHRPVELRHAQEERPEVQDHPGARDREAVRAVPRRAGLHGHEVRARPRRRRARRRIS